MVRILHFADAHIDMANYGRHDPESGLPMRVMDFLKSLDEIVDTAIEELLTQRAQAVVFDGPPLLYWLSVHPAASVALIPQAINHETYGVVFPEGSELREPVNRALLSLRENGRYERLYAEWFGDK